MTRLLVKFVEELISLLLYERFFRISSIIVNQHITNLLPLAKYFLDFGVNAILGCIIPSKANKYSIKIYTLCDAAIVCFCAIGGG